VVTPHLELALTLNRAPETKQGPEGPCFYEHFLGLMEIEYFNGGRASARFPRFDLAQFPCVFP
jgi:hypothetical protein